MYSRIKNKPFRFGDPVDVEESALIEVHPIEERRRGVSESAVYLYRRKLLLQEGSNYFQSLREDERERRERWNRRYSR